MSMRSPKSVSCRSSRTTSPAQMSDGFSSGSTNSLSFDQSDRSAIGTSYNQTQSLSSSTRKSSCIGLENEIRSRIRSSYAENARNSSVESLQMNKLRFSSLGLYGRKKEMKELRACFVRLVAGAAASARDGVKLEPPPIITPEDGNQIGDDDEIEEEPSDADADDVDAPLVNKPSEVIFISGESGTGKTALAESIKPLVARCKGIYISGKFDLYQREPYFGISSAMRELCTQLLQLKNVNPAKYHELCQGIKADVGDGIALLINICPDLDKAIDIPADIATVTDQGNKEAKERLKYVFAQFFRVLTRHLKHLVLAVDDLQWADIDGMDLLESLIKDRGNSLMFIGIYRSNEVNNAHYLSKIIRDMNEAKESGIFELSTISVGNLDMATCEEILVELLSTDPCHKTHSLAEIVHKRTLGNVFYTLAYLGMIQEEKLLSFNLGGLNWTWDSEKIEAETSATSNVVELVKSKLMKLPQAVCNILQLASCLGNSFETALLVCAFPKMFDELETGDTPEMEKEIHRLLSVAVDENLIEPQGVLRHAWIHDSIQAAAWNIVNEDEIALFQYRLGNVLLHSLSERDLENNLFVVANLMNATQCSESDKLAIAELNLKAAKKTTEFSAFESCLVFAEKGVALLPEDRWIQEKELSLELYSICSETHFSLGNIHKMIIYCDELLQQQSLTELEKVRANHCKISSLGGSGKASEALTLSLDVLGKLGCRFPRNTAGQVAKTLSSLHRTKMPKDDMISALPAMTDETKKACMFLMTHLATYAHMVNNPIVMIMAVSRMVRWTTKYGVDSSSAVGFAIFGFAQVMLFSAYELASQYADLGLRLLDNREHNTFLSRAMYITWFMVVPRSKPIHSTLKHLLRGYKIGMEVGDAESSMWNISMYICSSIIAGKSLNALAVDCQTYFDQMKLLKQKYIYFQSLPFWQFVLNMMGDAKDPLLMTGTAMNEQDYCDEIKQMDDPFASRLHYLIFKSMLCNFFGDYETGSKLACERGESYEKGNGSPLVFLDFLHQGISFYAMARKTRKKNFFRKAKKIKSTVSFWIKKGNVNVQHYLPLLEAEEAAFKGKSDNATRLYSKAISMASRSGFQHNAALASERFGEYLLNDLKDKGRARPYFISAAKYYSDWGSSMKAQMIEKKYLIAQQA